jgi:hypothetical protein
MLRHFMSERDSSKIASTRESAPIMGKFYDTNAPGITLNDSNRPDIGSSIDRVGQKKPDDGRVNHPGSIASRLSREEH